MFNNLKSLIKNILKKLTFFKLRIELAIKIYKISINLNNKKRFNASIHVKKWEHLTKYINTSWFQVYSNVSGVLDANYVPEDIYYGIIEPTLNDRILGLIFSNKNLYAMNYALGLFPKTLLHNIHGIFYNSDYKIIGDDIFSYCIDDKIIVKPSVEGGGGKNVELFVKDSTGLFYNSKKEELTTRYLEEKYKKNFIIQSYVNQHEYFGQFNKTSVNTIKVTTYRSVTTNRIIILHTKLRMGRSSSIIDNASAGGIGCSIDENGRLNGFAMDKQGNKYYEVNGRAFTDYEKVYKFDEVIRAAYEIADRNMYSRIMGIDLCVNNKGQVVILEINNQYSEVNFYQMHGKAYFGPYTDEVIEYCRKYKSRLND